MRILAKFAFFNSAFPSKEQKFVLFSSAFSTMNRQFAIRFNYPKNINVFLFFTIFIKIYMEFLETL